MPAIKDQAVVLRRLDYSETSQVLVFLTREHGVRRLIAKGVRRGTKQRFATGIDLLERGQVVFIARSQGSSGLATMSEWRQSEAYLAIRQHLGALYAAQYAAEITAAMTEEADPHPALFDALVQLLSVLQDGRDMLEPLTRYQRAALVEVGLWPDLSRCVVCDKPAPAGRAAYFSAQQGGLVCRFCEPELTEKRKVAAAPLTALRQDAVNAETARPVFELLDYTISHTIGRRVALATYVLGHADRA